MENENQNNDTNQQNSGDSAAGGQQTDWKAAFPQEFQRSIAKFDSPEALAKSYTSLETSFNTSGRKDAIFKPGPDATPEEISTFHSKLGRLDSADKYDMKIEGLADDKIAGIKQTAFNMGLNPDQAKIFTDTLTSVITDERNAAGSKETLRISEVQAQLKDRWGDEYEAMVDYGKQYAELADNRDIEKIRELSQTSPEFNIIMADLGKKAFGKKSILDDPMTQNPQSAHKMREQARGMNVEIQKLRKENPVGNAELIKQMMAQQTELYKQADALR